MAKSVAQKENPVVSKNKKKKRPKTNWRQVLIVGGVALALIAMLLPDILSNFVGRSAGPDVNITKPANMPEPKFSNEGELSFISAETGQPIRQIAIEKADNDMERGFGMMYRKSMEDTQGMLFLFDEAQPQSFWMKNTLIPLDIMFVDENFKILNIHENAKPLSQDQILSSGNAKYVVEVNGGFSKKYGIKAGDTINFR